MNTPVDLPIEEKLAEIRESLARGPRLVLAAPPGAGKTTRLPLALLGESWLAGKRLLILEPRRIAARLAASRMAATLGESVGETVGLSTRIERKVSARTRIEVITDGLAARRLIADPELAGVGAILFDEFHERSLALDLALALALEAQSALRPDLRLVIMSATLDTARLAARLDAPAIASEGRQFPIETIYAGRGSGPIDEHMARIIRRALREQQGSVLAFLPGQAEILRTAERLADCGARVVPLYGALSPAEQDAAVAPAAEGERKAVLATDIAESALTIQGVSTVIDSGLARIAAFDPDSGTRLSTERASRASVDQRRGRAGRTGPGVCYRLWDEEETRGLPAERTPEILQADLSGLILSLADWGERDPGRLIFLDPPPAGRLAAAASQLRQLGALAEDGSVTARGREMARLPLDPPLAAMIAGADAGPDRTLAAEIAALLSEKGLGGPGADLEDRLFRFRRDGSERARALRAQAARWSGGAAPPPPPSEAGRILAAALPSRIARKRSSEPGAYLLASGAAARLDPADPLNASPFLAVADLVGAGPNARILAAARLPEEAALALGGVMTADTARYDPATKSFKARRVRRLGAIMLSETPLPAPAPDAARAALAAALAEHGLHLLPALHAVRETQARLALARRAFGDTFHVLADDELIAGAKTWLFPLLGDPPSLDNPGTEEISRALLAFLEWERARELDEIAPLDWRSPAGRKLPIDYLAPSAPLVEARAQEFFGLRVHPTIARGRAPLSVSLLSPAGRQIALTRDIAAFWKGGYRDMAKDMRGRYPKHDWPDDPASARPHEGRTKARLKF
jgi:ATP-dependent helicase HrpB